MNFKNFLTEGVIKKRVKIMDGQFKGSTGTAVFTKLDDDLRYYVIELDSDVKDKGRNDDYIGVVVIYNGEFDWT